MTAHLWIYISFSHLLKKTVYLKWFRKARWSAKHFLVWDSRQPPFIKSSSSLSLHRPTTIPDELDECWCSSRWSLCHTRRNVGKGCDSFIHLIGKLPQLILWTPLCLCPCVKRSRLPQLARGLAKYWRLLVETQPVKTVWKEKDLDETWAKNTTGHGGGIQTHPDLPTGPVEERMDRTSKGREESRPPYPTERERQNNKGLGATQRMKVNGRKKRWNIPYLHECVAPLWSFYYCIMNATWSV